MDRLQLSSEGMRAAATAMTASANNVANVNTRDTPVRRQEAQEQPRREATTEWNVGADLAEEQMEQIRQSDAYDANRRMVQTQNERLGTVLNMVG